MSFEPQRRGWSMIGRVVGRAISESLERNVIEGEVAEDGEPPPDEELQRAAEESLVAALQESDTTVEVLHDRGSEAPRAQRTRLAVGMAGVLLGVVALVVVRRRR